ncbi:MAG: hypothetical protein GWM98_22000 [Nitrospinaceae bacterium]|nr:hypothetical protein [Nitrospinaceae bacterium]NIR56634.1 hypothetical protein [Nitrospinaceae bacterium]NIS87097.1 hypothetical protein [Nitrospinaceae bacterium]NIT83951.1 hypothetical protein [Nitrospinaceae bacterium]NIU46142.1 hypothetical protein [Nitrospinaceae bacterium]
MVAVIVSTGGKIAWNAYDEWDRAESLAASQPAQALEHYERVIHWHVPFLPLSHRAAERMWAQAERYEAAGDPENAINTYRVLRGAFYAARSFYTPGKEWIARCNEKIAGLMASRPAYSQEEQGKSVEQRKAEYLALLSEEKPPYPAWALLTEVGFFGWVACAFLFILQGFNPAGGFQTRLALRWAAGWGMFYGLWIWGLFRV